jgi:hypothetical protein
MNKALGCRLWPRVDLGHEPFTVEHRSHEGPGEQVEGQQWGGETDRERGTMNRDRAWRSRWPWRGSASGDGRSGSAPMAIPA